MALAAEHLAGAVDCLAQVSVEQLRCYVIDAEQRRLVAVPPDRVSAEWASLSSSSAADVWIDIQTQDPGQIQEFLKQLALHPLILEDCLDPFRSSRFSSYATSLHFEFPVYATDSVEDYLSVVCIPRMLLTIRTRPIPAVNRLLESLDAEAQLNDVTKAAVLYALLDGIGDGLIQAARDGRQAIRDLSHVLDNQPDAVDMEQIISVQRELQDITMIAEDQLYCLRGLLSVDSDALAISGQCDYLRDALRSYETALRVVHRYESRAAEMRQQYVFFLQAKTEARIRVLTILSSICMPLTLIAGVYGMNFAQMPETQWAWGYPVTLGAMLAIAGGQLMFFYRRGWLS